MAATKSGYEGKIAGLYDLDRTLGKGHFAVVKLARHVFTGQLVAVKVIDKTKLDALATGHLLQEVRCMKLVRHPNVVRLYEVIDTHTKLYLILELADGGDMYDYILRHEGGVAEDTAKLHFAQIVRAITYCHRLHVVHRDLKPENVVFFRQQGTVKLTDFGFSNHFQPGTMLMTSCGSLAYSAPEILLAEEYDAPAVDIWSLGVILYMLVCGHPPFQEATDSETLTMIMDCRYTVPDHVSAQCQDLIARMLQRDPSKRACLSEIEGHPWLQDTDPSPAAHTTAPLTSHRCLSAEEHELIVQAMTGGNIADRDTIQEALEADRYNHITATYYLLGERTLRNKSDQSGLVHEQRHTQRPLSAPLDLVDGRSPQAYPLRGVSLAPLAPLGSPSPGFVRRGVCESGDLLAPKPSQQDSSFADFGSPSTCLGLSFRSVSTDQPPTVKSLGALQQICEEEEEEEEEDEPINANLAPSAPPSESTRGRRSASESCGTSEQMDATRREIPGKRLCPILAEEEVFQQEGAEHGKKQEFQHSAAHPITEEQQGPTKEEKTKPPTEEAKRPEEPGGPRREEILSVSGGQRQRTPGLGEMGGAPLAPRLRAGRCCQAQREPSADVLEANNNTTPSKPRLLDADVIMLPGGSPRPLPKNHCVDARPDTVETRRAGGESVEKVEEAQAKHPQAKRGSRDGGADPATARVNPGKSKNVNLRDRLLHFPICEKALSFNIQPASKEKLLPFAQYNCCHVL
ncbi:SNF related kinase b [Electrophorus electricus]|uniref:SNF-related serine/threonine-protein kinase n=1 Tax=Electrophorus electricus TaxID=8005 RepID=A0A4W4FYQ7_ELEEL|nr:SNF related kinase b [Electrophorus electricus]